MESSASTHRSGGNLPRGPSNVTPTTSITPGAWGLITCLPRMTENTTTNKRALVVGLSMLSVPQPTPSSRNPCLSVRKAAWAEKKSGEPAISGLHHLWALTCLPRRFSPSTQSTPWPTAAGRGGASVRNQCSLGPHSHSRTLARPFHGLIYA
jgi:hypothetical protein